jgi:hypothetical protein
MASSRVTPALLARAGADLAFAAFGFAVLTFAVFGFAAFLDTTFFAIAPSANIGRPNDGEG